jgi:hypothetical protein
MEGNKDYYIQILDSLIKCVLYNSQYYIKWCLRKRKRNVLSLEESIIDVTNVIMNQRPLLRIRSKLTIENTMKTKILFFTDPASFIQFDDLDLESGRCIKYLVENNLFYTVKKNINCNLITYTEMKLDQQFANLWNLSIGLEYLRSAIKSITTEREELIDRVDKLISSLKIS